MTTVITLAKLQEVAATTRVAPGSVASQKMSLATQMLHCRAAMMSANKPASFNAHHAKFEGLREQFEHQWDVVISPEVEIEKCFIDKDGTRTWSKPYSVPEYESGADERSHEIPMQSSRDRIMTLPEQYILCIVKAGEAASRAACEDYMAGALTAWGNACEAGYAPEMIEQLGHDRRLMRLAGVPHRATDRELVAMGMERYC